MCIAVLVYDGLKCQNMVELLEIYVKKKEEKYSNVMRDCPEAKADFLVLYNGQDVPTIEVLNNNQPNKTDQ